MATKIRPELSIKNKYYIDKHRHYELKHFCLQYHEWKRAYNSCDGLNASRIDDGIRSSEPGDPTAKYAMKKAYYLERIQMVERAAMDADQVLCNYILKAVTEELSYTYLKSKLKIPCGKDMYYDRYRRFFWLLSNSRG